MKVTKRKDQDLYINTPDELDNFIYKYVLKDSISPIKCEWIYESTKHIECISITDLIKQINKLLTVKYPKRCSVVCEDYYIVRGYDLDSISDEISRLQRSRSKRCVEHWVNKGYTQDEAVTLVINYQKKNSAKANAPKTKDYWLSLGKDDSEAISLARYYSGISSSRCVEYWVNKGHTEEDARKIISKNSDNGSLNYYITKYGKELGKTKYLETNTKKARFGPDNGQYGKPCPKGAGHGISGYYKKYYFRSTFEYFAIKYFESYNIIFKELDILNSSIRVTLPNNKTYRPDFLINNDTIVEVKPLGLLNNETVLLKKKCCLEQYPQFSYKFLTENDLNIDMKILKKDVDKGIVTIDKGKLLRYNNNIKSIG